MIFVFRINKNISLKFTDAGHILGSSAVNLSITENDIIKKICFTGRYRAAKKPDPQAS